MELQFRPEEEAQYVQRGWPTNARLTSRHTARVKKSDAGKAVHFSEREQYVKVSTGNMYER